MKAGWNAPDTLVADWNGYADALRNLNRPAHLPTRTLLLMRADAEET
jgi:hypothetical protein